MNAIVELIKDSAELDLSHYKKSSIERSVNRRMRAAGAGTLSDYVFLLRSDSRELLALVSEITVDFSLFFRDEGLFEILKNSVLPAIIQRNKASARNPFRVWCAGCGAGEEAYSVTILLFEALKGSVGRDRVAIFATDVDPSSLQKSRDGAYPPESVKNVSPATLERYFTFDRSYRIKNFVKDLICFGEHNLLNNPPISRIDLLLCRNVLIYLDKGGQSVVLKRLRYAVRPGGYLVLGKSEGLSQEVSESFTVVDRVLKIFQRKDDDKWPFSCQ